MVRKYCGYGSLKFLCIWHCNICYLNTFQDNHGWMGASFLKFSPTVLICLAHLNLGERRFSRKAENSTDGKSGWDSTQEEWLYKNGIGGRKEQIPEIPSNRISN